jgi:hypothetical protein
MTCSMTIHPVQRAFGGEEHRRIFCPMRSRKSFHFLLLDASVQRVVILLCADHLCEEAEALRTRRQKVVHA